MQGKVSLITPCYNGMEYIQLYIDNIQRQDYPFVQVIFVNDGSVDETVSMIPRVEAAVKAKGYEFCYLSKENGGAASAVNYGLQYVSGDYLMLLDMDDKLYEEAVSAKAAYLEEHPEQDAVISNGFYVFEDARRKACPFCKGQTVAAETIFEQLLNIRFYNWPGSYMVRWKSFLEVNRGKDILVSPYGQNLQILLPAVYRRRVGFLDRKLMDYYVRNHSASHTENQQRMIQMVNGYENIREMVIRKICQDPEERDHYIRIIDIAAAREKLRYACRIYNKEELDNQYERLKNLNGCRTGDKFIYLCGQSKTLTTIYKTIRYIVDRVTNRVI